MSNHEEIDSIGIVDNINGEVFITRNGIKIVAIEGMPLYEGDVIQTEVNGNIGIIYTDDTTVALSGDSRMVIESMSFDPDAGVGNFSTYIVQGTFSFVSGEVAKLGNDAMVFKTPVAIIGIRGTTVAGTVGAEGEQNTFTLLPDANGGVGSISVTNSAGTYVLTQPNQTTTVGSFFIAPVKPFIMSASQITQHYGTVTSMRPIAPKKIDDDKAIKQIDNEAIDDGDKAINETNDAPVNNISSPANFHVPSLLIFHTPAPLVLDINKIIVTIDVDIPTLTVNQHKIIVSNIPTPEPEVEEELPTPPPIESEVEEEEEELPTPPPINDAPTSSNPNLLVMGNEVRVLTEADFGFTDADSITYVKITKLALLGTLTLDGNDMKINQGNISVADIAEGKLIYEPYLSAGIALAAKALDKLEFQLYDGALYSNDYTMVVDVAMVGNDSGDILRGSGSSEILIGGHDDDTLNGQNGNDDLYGGDGCDTLLAGSGNDMLNGGADTDTLSGGEGADIFQFTSTDVIIDFSSVKEVDTITDFLSTQEDTIELEGFSLGNSLTKNINYFEISWEGSDINALDTAIVDGYIEDQIDVAVDQPYVAFLTFTDDILYGDGTQHYLLYDDNKDVAGMNVIAKLDGISDSDAIDIVDFSIT